jgi:hypothetical protein
MSEREQGRSRIRAAPVGSSRMLDGERSLRKRAAFFPVRDIDHISREVNDLPS